MKTNDLLLLKIKCIFITMMMGLYCNRGEMIETKMTFQGQERYYYTYVPPTNKQNATALIVTLHGAGGNGKSLCSTGYEKVMEYTSAVVVCPSARNHPGIVKKKEVASSSSSSSTTTNTNSDKKTTDTSKSSTTTTDKKDTSTSTKKDTTSTTKKDSSSSSGKSSESQCMDTYKTESSCNANSNCEWWSGYNLCYEKSGGKKFRRYLRHRVHRRRRLLNAANGSPCWKAFAKFGVCNNNQPEDSEDVLFINEIITRLTTLYNIPTGRV